MSRQVRLSELTDREKDTAILTLSGFARSQGELLRELAERSPYAKRRLGELLETYAPRMAFLERAYVRELARGLEQRRIRQNDGIWDRLEVEA